METMHNITGFQRDILWVVVGCDEPPHGLGILNELEDYYEEDVNEGRLYPNLNDLVEEGFLEKEPVDKRQNAYILTSKGRNALRNHERWKGDKCSKLKV